VSEIKSGSLIDGRYRVRHQLGQGGMSAQWLGYDEQLKRAVVLDQIFVLDHDGSDRAAALARLDARLRLGVRLAGHPRLEGR